MKFLQGDTNFHPSLQYPKPGNSVSRHSVSKNHGHKRECKTWKRQDPSEKNSKSAVQNSIHELNSKQAEFLQWIKSVNFTEVWNCSQDAGQRLERDQGWHKVPSAVSTDLTLHIVGRPPEPQSRTLTRLVRVEGGVQSQEPQTDCTGPKSAKTLPCPLDHRSGYASGRKTHLYKH